MSPRTKSVMSHVYRRDVVNALFFFKITVSAPTEVRNVQISFSTEKPNVTWEKPSRTQGVFGGYQITVRDSAISLATTATTEQTSYVYSDAECSKTYVVH